MITFAISVGLSLRPEHGYNLLMQRAALFTLLVASVLGGSLQAQRAAATFHGNAARSPGRSGFVGRRGVPNRFLTSHSHFHHNGAGAVFDPYFVPYDEPFGYEQPEHCSDEWACARSCNSTDTGTFCTQSAGHRDSGRCEFNRRQNATADDIHPGKRRATGNSSVCAHGKQFVFQH